MNSFFYSGGYQPEYLAAKRSEQTGLRKNSMILAALLLIYNIFLLLFTNGYIYVYYFIKTGSVSLDKSKVSAYIYDSLSEISVTEFEMFGNAFVTFMSLAAILLIAKLVFDIAPSNYMKTNKAAVKTGLIAFPFALLLNYAVSIVSSYISAVFESGGIVLPTADFSVDKPTFIAGFSLFCYMVALGPVIEEIVYRGFVLKLIAPYSKTTAVFISAFFFGLMHGNFAQFASAFATGIVYASVAVYSGSIIPTIIMHIMNNGLGFIAICASDYGIEQLDTVYSVLFVIILLLGVLDIFIYRKIVYRREMSRSLLTSGERMKAIFLNIPMLLYVAYLFYDFFSQIITANS